MPNYDSNIDLIQIGGKVTASRKKNQGKVQAEMVKRQQQHLFEFAVANFFSIENHSVPCFCCCCSDTRRHNLDEVDGVKMI
jgi:hypothetical protein